MLLLVMALAGAGMLSHRRHADRARYLKAMDELRVVADGLERYRDKHGTYPAVSDWEGLISMESPLVRERYIPEYLDLKDLWGSPFRGASQPSQWRLSCSGKPGDPETYPPAELAGCLVPEGTRLTWTPARR